MSNHKRVNGTGFATSWPAESGEALPCPGCGGTGQDEHEIRCHDCFGSGVRGDGQVSVLASRELARCTDCPKCGAGAGQPCEGIRGAPRSSCHQERHRRAVAQLLEGVIDRRHPVPTSSLPPR
jgi:hypothetical protein